MRRTLRALRPWLLLPLFALASGCGLLADEFMSFDGRPLPPAAGVDR